MDDPLQSRIRHLDLLGSQAIGLQLTLHEIPLRDLQLLLFRVTGELDDLHAIPQRPGNGLQDVRGRDEQHPAQVERLRDVVVAERAVLLRIQHLEQRRRRIALVAGIQLVDLIQHEHRVAGARLLQALDDVARQRADVGAPMAADFRFIVHATEARPLELQAQRPRDALPQRRLAHARRSDEAQDRAATLRIQLAHGEVLENAALHFVEAIVVLVQNATRALDIDVLGVGSRSTASATSQSR